MHWTTTRRALALLLPIVLPAACGGTPERADDGGTSERAAPRGEVRGTLGVAPEGDAAVERELETLLGAMRRVDGKRVVDFELRNRGERALEVAYTVEWMNRRGEPVGAGAPWVLVYLPPGGAVPIEATAPSREAESWSVRAVEPGAAQD